MSLIEVLASLALTIAVWAQQLPVRDAGITRPGTAVISGIVTTTDSDHKAIARASVTLTGAELRPSLTVIADNAGRFGFSNLPAGQFTISASKAGYVTMAYGQTTADKGSGVPVSLTDGQQMTTIALALPKELGGSLGGAASGWGMMD